MPTKSGWGYSSVAELVEFDKSLHKRCVPACWPASGHLRALAPRDLTNGAASVFAFVADSVCAQGGHPGQVITGYEAVAGDAGVRGVACLDAAVEGVQRAALGSSGGR